MNATPGLADWAVWLGRLTAGSVLIAIVAALAARVLGPSGRRQCAVWRGGLLALALFAAGEIFGAGVWALSWLQSGQEAEARPPRAAIIAQAPQKPIRHPVGEELPSHDPVEDDAQIARDDAPDNSANLAAAAATPSGGWWPGLLWLAGTGILLARFLVGRALLGRLRRHCPAVTDGCLLERVQSVARRLGLRRPISIREAQSVMGPATFGVRRPTLILPKGFADQAPAAQEAMLAHELAHLAGHDAAWQALADLVRALLWWLPPVWWARARLLAANETAADEASTIVADGPSLLASCLVELGKRLTPSPGPAWLGVAGGGLARRSFRSQLGRRVERLLQLGQAAWQPPRPLRAALFSLLLILVLGGGTIVGTAWAQTHIFSEGDQTMKNGQASWRRSLAGMVLVSTLTLGADASPAGAQPAGAAAAQKRDGGPGPAGGAGRSGPGDVGGALKPGAAAPDDAELVLKVYRLTQRDPEGIANIAHMLLAGEALPQMMAPGGEGPAGPRGATMPGGFVPGPGVFPGGFNALGALGGAGFQGGFGALGGGFPGGGFPGAVNCATRFAPDKRTRTLIVRGPKDDVQLVTDLVAVLDRPSGKDAPKVKGLHLFHLKHADPKSIREVFHRLDIPLRVALDPESRSLIVLADDGTDIREVRQVIEALDIEVTGKSPEKK